jgi:hypothetical protein
MVEVTVNLYDKDDKLIDTTDSYVGPIEPNSTIYDSIYYDEDKKYERYEVKFKAEATPYYVPVDKSKLKVTENVVEDEMLIQKIEEGEYLVNANIYIEDLFDDLDLGKTPETQYSKLSGWLYGSCEDIPEEGYNFTYISKYIAKTDDEDYEEVIKRLTFVVTKVEDRRILEARLFIEVIDEEDSLDEEEDND